MKKHVIEPATVPLRLVVSEVVVAVIGTEIDLGVSAGDRSVDHGNGPQSWSRGPAPSVPPESVTGLAP